MVLVVQFVLGMERGKVPALISGQACVLELKNEKKVKK